MKGHHVENLSSLAAPEFVFLTIFHAVSDDTFVITTTFQFQYILCRHQQFSPNYTFGCFPLVLKNTRFAMFLVCLFIFVTSVVINGLLWYTHSLQGCFINIGTIDQFHKSQNAPVSYPIMLHSEHSILNGALWDMEQVHSGVCDLGQLHDWASEISLKDIA